VHQLLSQDHSSCKVPLLQSDNSLHYNYCLTSITGVTCTIKYQIQNVYNQACVCKQFSWQLNHFIFDATGFWKF